MNRVWHEPLFRFLLGGTALFLVYFAVADEPGAQRDQIVVGEEQVAMLATTFERTWMRSPTRGELESLVKDFVDEEILYRQALELGLDRNDLVVRRRLRQKMEFLHLDLAEPTAPTEAELAAFLTANPDRFREPERLTFRQLYANPEADGAEARQRVETWLTQLRTKESESEIAGDRTMLPDAMQHASESEVAAAFGSEFAEDLFALPAAPGDRWHGPVASSFGLHLVRLEARVPGRLPPLSEIRHKVERELATKQREQANRKFLEALRERYEVDIRMPAEDTVAATTASER